jgi:2-iminobutanoate/2-iminopropanoate deaminase
MALRDLYSLTNCVAQLLEVAMNSSRSVISTTKAPAALGPYSQAIRSGDFLFVSGQIALEPISGNMIDGDIQAQTDRVLRNISAILDASGLELKDVVKTTCYLRDLGDFANFNIVYGSYFTVNHPARETVEVSSLPRDALVEISCIAVASGSG